MRPRDLVALEFDVVRRRVADFAASPVGKELCRELTPSNDTDLVNQQLDATHQCFRLCETTGDLPLGEFPDIRASARSASHDGAVLDGVSLVAIRQVLDAGELVRLHLRKVAEPFEHLRALAERLVPLRELHSTLRRALDDTGDVSDDASDELAGIRRELRVVRARVQRKLEDLFQRPGMEDILSDRFVTLRNNRFVIPVKTPSASHFDGIVQDRSVSGETTFVEPLFAVELNNRLLVAAREEERMVRRILADLTALVRDELVLLMTTFEALTELDALAARARFARDYRCTRPVLDDQEILLRDARHPALLFGDRPVIPTDLLLPPGKRVLVITGPNTGGKTVALKTLGLMALMAQSGLLIPVLEGGRLPCFRAIYADVGDEQSIARNLSTFSAHLANLTHILSQRETPMLVLLDEPGVGTDPEEGAALGIGLLQTLAARQARVVVTTHYAGLKVFALSDPRCATAAVEFDVAALQARYRLVYNSVGESLALPIARRLGMPAEVLDAAELARTDSSRAMADAMTKLETARRQYEERLTEAEDAARNATQARQQSEQLLEELREKRRRKWSTELEEADNFLRDLRERGRLLLAEVERGGVDRKRLKQFVTSEDAVIEERRAEVAPPESGMSSAKPAIGDQVQVAGQGIRGELLAVEGERAWIQRGSLRFEVPAAVLRKVEGAAPKAVEVRIEPMQSETGSEISLLGLRAQEAIDRLQVFLDHAARGHLATVRIIHGLGSGALKRAVAEYLARSPYCSAFRPGVSGEGGAGVTVAELSAG